MYKLIIEPKEGTEFNPIHRICNNALCTGAFVDKGYGANIMLFPEDAGVITTSAVLGVSYEGETMHIETKNTLYHLEPCEGD